MNIENKIGAHASKIAWKNKEDKMTIQLTEVIRSASIVSLVGKEGSVIAAIESNKIDFEIDPTIATLVEFDPDFKTVLFKNEDTKRKFLC